MNDPSLAITYLRDMAPVLAAEPDRNPEFLVDGKGANTVRVNNIDVAFVGEGSLASAFPVTDLSVASIAAPALGLAQLMSRQFGVFPRVVVDRRLASFWFGTSLRPIGWELPALRGSITGDYAAADGWIRLHANAPHHRDAALRVLGVTGGREDAERAVSTWTALDLESAIIEAGGCAAVMRSQQDWAIHAQGRAVGAEPLIAIEDMEQGPEGDWAGTPARPLAGLKVLDLTRVLAGPVSTRFLAGYGAQVLRIDPPFWSEPGAIPEVVVGKRCAYLDLRDGGQLEQFKTLLRQADVLVHGYRPDALERLGLGAAERQRLRPGLIDVCLNAYGWTGPWSRRRGFDSLVQMSSGIAHTGMHAFGQQRPTPLPVQALDHATGYLMAAAVIHGLERRLATGVGSLTRLSLARTAALLVSRSAMGPEQGLAPEAEDDLAGEAEETHWGPARRIRPPCEISDAAMRWDYPANPLGSSAARWV